MIYLEEFRCQFEAILHESAAKKKRRHETIDLIKSSSEKRAGEIARLTSSLEQAEVKFREKIKPRQQAVQTLTNEMTQLETDNDDKISEIM